MSRRTKEQRFSMAGQGRHVPLSVIRSHKQRWHSIVALMEGRYTDGRAHVLLRAMDRLNRDMEDAYGDVDVASDVVGVFDWLFVARTEA